MPVPHPFLLGVLSLCPLCLCGSPSLAADPPRVVVGSKSFTESVILGEVVTQVVRGTGAEVIHRQQLGGTAVLWKALLSGEIDVYPDYTGTIRQELLGALRLSNDDAVREHLAGRGIVMSQPLGFNDTYVIGMKEEVAARLGIRTISDLCQHPELKFGFTNEVMKRADGWPGLKERYQLPQRDVRGMEHSLAYPALESGAIQATDLYSTDPDIRYYGLRELVDDLHFFPQYYAVLLYRADLKERAPGAEQALLKLEGRIPLAAIREMNERAKPKTGVRVPENRVAAEFLADNPYFHKPEETGSYGSLPEEESLSRRLLILTGQHLFLVGVSLAAAIVIAVPLGVLAARRPRLGQAILGSVGVIQTIPSLALLVFFIPLFGIGPRPAIVALFLYSLLPIVRNTFAGLHDLSASLRESAWALGLPPAARLRLVELPMASRAILAGIKTSAVINVGTATLGGLIGAGGYGESIVTGLRLADNRIILEGAIPAAVLALVVQGLFELAERWVVPRGLRLQGEA